MFAYGIKDANIINYVVSKNACMVYTTLNCRVNSGQHLSLSNKGFTEGIRFFFSFCLDREIQSFF